MEKFPPHRAKQLNDMFARWRRDPWPMPSGLHEPVSQKVLTAELARQEWEDEGGTVRPPVVPGPKLPL